MAVKVSVIVCAYNQEQTVARTLDHVLNQQTDYSYEIIIGEDCSKDGTRSLCEQYATNHPSIIKLLPKAPNKGLMRNYRDCLAEATGEYIMACAADDWWHNPLKIQKQVTILEEHPECVLTYSGCYRYNVMMGTTTAMKVVIPQGDMFDALLPVDFICAPTVCYRSSILQKISIDEYIAAGYPMEDYPMWLDMANYGTFYPLDEETVTYTHNSNSASTFMALKKQVEFEGYVQQVRKDMVAKYKKEHLYSLKDLEDIYWRNLYSHGIKFNNRKFSLESILKVNKKNGRDYLKILMASNQLTYNIIRKRNQKFATV